MVFIIILDHENMSIDTLFETLSLILLKILNKRDFFGNRRTDLHIQKIPKVFRLTTRLDFVSSPMRCQKCLCIKKLQLLAFMIPKYRYMLIQVPITGLSFSRFVVVTGSSRLSIYTHSTPSTMAIYNQSHSLATRRLVPLLRSRTQLTEVSHSQELTP